MLPRSDPKKRVHPECPKDVARQVDVVLASSLVSKPVFAGETLIDVVQRYCPGIYDGPAAHGFQLRFDMPENTHKALIRGKLFYQIRRAPIN